MKEAVVLLATALAIIVFPVPGGPYINTPLGRINPDLAVQLELGQGQLDGLAHLLFLDI